MASDAGVTSTPSSPSDCNSGGAFHTRPAASRSPNQLVRDTRPQRSISDERNLMPEAARQYTIAASGAFVWVDHQYFGHSELLRHLPRHQHLLSASANS